MSQPPHQDRTFTVLAAPGAADALRAIGLDPRPGMYRPTGGGTLLRARTHEPEAARAALRPLPVDWCVRAADAPAPRLFVSDMDSSVIEQECIDELADFAGRKDEVAEITRRAMAGELDFRAALAARVRLLAGFDSAVLARCRAERVRLRPGARALVSALRGAGAYTALVSGGFDEFVGPVAAEAGFHAYRTNRLIIEAGALTGAVEEPVLDAQAKADILLALAGQTGAAPEESIAMGDGANDLPMLRAAGFAIAVGGGAALAAADAAVRGGDLGIVSAFLGLGPAPALGESRGDPI